MLAFLQTSGNTYNPYLSSYVIISKINVERIFICEEMRFNRYLTAINDKWPVVRKKRIEKISFLIEICDRSILMKCKVQGTLLPFKKLFIINKFSADIWIGLANFLATSA